MTFAVCDHTGHPYTEGQPCPGCGLTHPTGWRVNWATPILITLAITLTLLAAASWVLSVAEHNWVNDQRDRRQLVHDLWTTTTRDDA